MTEPAYRLIGPQANRSFVFKWEPFNLKTRWHYHPELELIYFIEGRTTGVIGEGFQQFDEGDLVLLGSNFPHVLQENKEFARQHPHCQPFGLIIQFTPDFLGADFLNKPELQVVKKLLQKADRGLRFHKGLIAQVAPLLLSMYNLNETRKLLSLLDVLITLSESEAYDCMTPEGYAYDPTQDEERMRCIHCYVYERFSEPISLKEIASIANMTETSFCRYFKTRTLKHFTQYLNEIRIAYACRLLNNNHLSVTHACYESGFTSLSYFNRQFKAVMNTTPSQYQKWKLTAIE
ncbi:MAG: AraC family transcriptional regulator [Bacteroidota bacterium]|nr:AraC family transcriptional regulator [Bacteroidota bacterium]